MGNDKTKWIFDDDAADGDTEFTEDLTHPPAQPLVDEGPTRATLGGEKTEIYIGGSAKKYSDAVGAELSGDMEPVVGWLVVVQGPGLGQSITLGPGVNTIGRDPNERVSLPFGDNLISSKDHAKIFYDDGERAFYIAHGSGRNITRMNGSIVANPVPLENFATVELSKVTHLRFVAFCNEEFDWSDLQREGDDQG